MRYADDSGERNLNIMCFRRFVHAALALLGVSVILVTSSGALAAPSVALRGVVTRQIYTHSDLMTYNWISRSDCLSDDVLHFPLTVTEGAGAEVEVWVGQGSSDCTVKTARTPTPSCLRIFHGLPTPSIQTVDIRVQDIVLVEQTITPGVDGQNAGTAEACQDTNGGTAADSVNLYFMLIGSTELLGAPATWPTKIDLLGPSPPTLHSLGPGSTLLKPEWDPNTDPDVAGYSVFCDPGGPSDAAIGATGSSGACVDASIDSPPVDAAAPVDEASANDAPGDSIADDGGADGPIAYAPAATDGGTCVAPGTPTICGDAGAGGNFIPNTLPSLDVINRYQCGSVGDRTSSSVRVTGLTNLVTVAVAVAATDLVGNVGPLSNVSCGTPEPVNGFDELYHQGGGTAGGGFCSISHLPGKRGGAGAGGLSFVVLAIWVQRRRARVASK